MLMGMGWEDILNLINMKLHQMQIEDVNELKPVPLL